MTSNGLLGSTRGIKTSLHSSLPIRFYDRVFKTSLKSLCKEIEEISGGTALVGNPAINVAIWKQITGKGKYIKESEIPSYIQIKLTHTYR